MPKEKPDAKYIAFIKTIGDVRIVYPEGSLQLIDKEGYLIPYTSGKIIPAGEYTVFGKRITSIKFKEDNFTSIYIERNDEQTNADRMCANLTKLITLSCSDAAFSKRIGTKDLSLNCTSLE